MKNRIIGPLVLATFLCTGVKAQTTDNLNLTAVQMKIENIETTLKKIDLGDKERAELTATLNDLKNQKQQLSSNQKLSDQEEQRIKSQTLTGPEYDAWKAQKYSKPLSTTPVEEVKTKEN